jgi:class 3 adenylate cyclase/TolB-like protein/tetratricopeptide (TPR) repeat protein
MDESSELSTPFDRRSTTIVVVDLVESVRLIHASEDEAIRHWWAFTTQVRDVLLAQYGGRLIKSLGDGLLLAFGDARSAVRCAHEMHETIKKSNAGRPPEAWMLLRIAVHEAEVFTDDIDIYGKGVNLTARLATLAAPGEVVASVEIHDRLIADVDAELTDLGECHVKHLVEPVRAYRVGPPGAPALLASNIDRDGLFQASVAVLRFAVKGQDDRASALGELVADSLVSHLSTCPELHVISRLSSLRFSGRPMSLAKAAHHLRANFLVSGSCYMTGDAILAVAELADSHTGTAIWSGRLSVRVADLLNEGSSAISDMATEIVRAIVNSEIRRSENRSLPTLEASTLLFGAIALMHRQNQHDLEYARKMLERLAELHPRHATPWAWMAKSYAISAAQFWPGKDSAQHRAAREAVDRAVANEPGNSLAWTIRGLLQGYFDKDFDAAGASYEAALSRNPSEALAWLYLSTLRGWQGRGREAGECADKALRLSPIDPMKYYFESLASAALLAAEVYLSSIELGEPSLRHNRMHPSSFRVLEIQQVLSGDHASATETISSLLVRDPTFTVHRFEETSPWMRSPKALLFKQALLEAGVPA